MKTSKIVIFGCGGHSRSVVSVLLACDPRAKLLFVDSNAKLNEKLYGFDVVLETFLQDEKCFFAIGDNAARKAKYDLIGTSNLISILSTQASIGFQARIGKGVFIGNFCHIGPEAAIGDNTIINNGAVVEHEVTIGQHAHIGPNATISGRSHIGDLVFIGVGATVKDSIKICSGVIVGAGAVVVKDITEPGIYVGCPAVKMRSLDNLPIGC